MSATTILSSTNYFWIGINDIATEGEFQYATGGDLVYTNWNNGQPNNNNNKEDCVVISNSDTSWFDPGSWFDTPCSDQYPSICEMI